MMTLWEWLIVAALTVLVLFCLAVFIDWLNYMDLQRRLEKERQAKRRPPPTLGRNAVIIEGIALDNIDAYVPVVVSDSSAPGETLLIAPVFFNPEGEIDPGKVVKIVNLEEDEK